MSKSVLLPGLLLGLCSFALRAQDDDPTLALAGILLEKGAITASDLNRVQKTDNHHRVNVLASILQDKGVLNTTDVARLSLPPTGGNAKTDGEAVAATVIPAATAPAPQSAPQQGGTSVEASAATKKGWPVSFYGTLLLTAGFNDANFNYEDIPMIASKGGSDPISSDARNFYETPRQTRLGINLDPVDEMGGKLSGRFEVDLMGGSAPYATGVTMSLFRLRLAYGRMDWDHWSVEAGQDWSIFAPLNPTSLTAYGIPEFTGSGNPWIRLPQIRIEGKNKTTNGNGILWQFAASDPNLGDNSTTSIVVTRQPGIGERGRMPSLDSRLALTKTYDDRDFTVGFSGHYGRGENAGTLAGVEVQQPVDSWGGALDWSLPFTKKFNLTGEAYEGRALGLYSVAAGEAIGVVGTSGGHGVLSRGGWIQGQLNFTKQWQMNLAYGVDNPDARELPVGSRNRNQQYMVNIIDYVTRNVNLSVEYRRILTDYRNQLFANERGDHVDLGIAYIF